MSTRLAALCAVLAIGSAPAMSAQEATAPALPPWMAVPVTVDDSGDADDETLAAFVDGLVSTSLQDDSIAGVVVAIVDRSRTRLLRGYGNATFAPDRAVDPAATLFRLGSISKTFTAIAAMQLAEQGRLDLQAEANRYLPDALQLPDEGWPPVRVHHLMSHTAGFEDSALGHLFVFDPARVQPLDDYLATHRPRRVRAPGEAVVYSNYAVALLGAMVARVSGESFDEHLKNVVFTPLGMSATRFDEPAAAADRTVWSGGFVRRDGRYVDKPFEIIGQLAPAGSASSTGADMARYLRMLVNRGELDGERVLATATFDELATISARNADAVGGIAHGFFRRHYGRHESLEHGGATLWFHSNLVALPDAGIGVFVSANTETGRRLARELPRRVFEFVLADARPSPAPAARADFASRGQAYAGTYLGARRNVSTLEKVTALFNAVVDVRTDGDALVVTGNGSTQRFVEESPHVFRAQDGEDRIVFLEDPSGGIRAFAGSYGHNVFERASMIDAPRTFALVGGALVLTAFGVVLCAWRRSAKPAKMRIREGRASAALLVATAFGWLVVVASLAVAAIGLASAGGEAVVVYPTPLLRAAVTGLHVVAGASLACALTLPVALRARGWSAGRRLRHVLAVIVMLAGVALAVRWNLLLAPLALGA
jgi:CubicO group peptidase (beta-lactamase class C family)